MYAVIRRWTGASRLMEEMQSRADEVRQLIGGVRGTQAYYAVRSGDTVTTVSICADEASANETTRVARQWVRDNLPGVELRPPEVTGGDVFLTLAGGGQQSLGTTAGAEAPRPAT